MDLSEWDEYSGTAHSPDSRCYGNISPSPKLKPRPGLGSGDAAGLQVRVVGTLTCFGPSRPTPPNKKPPISRGLSGGRYWT